VLRDSRARDRTKIDESSQPSMVARLSHHRSRVKLALFETKRERHRQPGQIQAASNHDVLQIQPPRIDLILELIAALAKQARRHGAPCAIQSTVEDEATPKHA
jgi:hypothetical protein